MHRKLVTYPIILIGVREAAINVAEGQKRSRVLTSEAYMTEKINQAKGIYTYFKFASIVEI